MTNFIAISHGKSMNPLINEGDQLFIRKVKKSNIALGDIVIFLNKSRCISHRVIFKKRDRVVVKGDNVVISDRSLGYEEILGKVVKIKGRYGVINLEKKIVRLFQLYFWFRSVILWSMPTKMYKPLSQILRGRRYLTKSLSLREKKLGKW